MSSASLMIYFFISLNRLVLYWIVTIVTAVILGIWVYRFYFISLKFIRARKITRSGIIKGKKVYDVLEGKYSDANIGGGVVLAQMEIPKSEWDLLFTPVTDDKALVNMALLGKVEVEKVVLDTIKDQKKRSSVYGNSNAEKRNPRGDWIQCF